MYDSPTPQDDHDLIFLDDLTGKFDKVIRDSGFEYNYLSEKLHLRLIEILINDEFIMIGELQDYKNSFELQELLYAGVILQYLGEIEDEIILYLRYNLDLGYEEEMEQYKIDQQQVNL